MRPEYRLSIAPLARADLRVILRSGHQAWGKNRSDAYVKQLLDTMETLSRFPLLGRQRSDYQVGLRSYATGRHVIYYVVDGQFIRIARVLHTRMDAHAYFMS